MSCISRSFSSSFFHLPYILIFFVVTQAFLIGYLSSHLNFEYKEVLSNKLLLALALALPYTLPLSFSVTFQVVSQPLFGSSHDYIVYLEVYLLFLSELDSNKVIIATRN